MRRILVAFLVLLGSVTPALAVNSTVPPRTVFDAAAGAWAVGTVVLSQPMPYRGGRLLLFPAQFADVLYAKQGKPRNMMLVYEVPAAEVGKPFYSAQDRFFAPIQLLPQHAYWRDNLPLTPRHGVAGGSRNVFRGDEIPEASRVLGLYLKAHQIDGTQRWGAELDAVAQALSSSVARLSEDAVLYLATSPRLGKDFPGSAVEPTGRFLEGPAPASLRIRLIDALGLAGVKPMTAELTKLAAGQGTPAAAASVALAQIQTGASLDRVLELSRSSSEELRAYAALRLGRDFGGEAAAADRAAALLAADQPLAVREAAAAGLGRPGNSKAIAPLRAALLAGDDASTAAADALARIGGDEAGKALQDALVSGPVPAALAAVGALPHIVGCADCGTVLRQQAAKNPDRGVRDRIGALLEIPKPHPQ